METVLEPRTLSEDAVLHLAERIVRFVRLPLSITWTEGRGPAIAIGTNEMLLPRSLCQESREEIVFTVGHEVGHPVVFPRNRHWSDYYQMLAATLGYERPHHFVNLIGDLFVNDWNLTRTPWRRVFAEAATSFYEPDPSSATDKRWSFLSTMMTGRLAELGGRKPNLSGRLLPEAYELLFHDRRSRRERFENLAELLVHRLGTGENARDDYVKQPREGGLREEGAGGPDEQVAWEAAVRGLGPGAVLDFARKERRKTRSLFDAVGLAAFSVLMAIEERSASGGREDAGPKVRRLWRPGNSPLELRMPETIRRHGVLIPGVTTARRAEGPQKERSTAGSGTLFLVLDTSGSMVRDLAGVLVVAWAAAIDARRRGHRVAALEFASQPSYLVQPGYEFGKLRTILETLQPGGGTRLVPAVGEIVRKSRRDGRRPTAVIFTDAAIADSPDAALEALAEIPSYGGKAIVCLPRRKHLNRWVRTGMENGVMEAFTLDDLSSIQSAVRAMR